MLSLQRKLVESCTIIPKTVNRYGDDVWGTPVTTRCLYRDISTLHQVNYQESVTIEGIFWFPPTSTAIKGRFVSYGGEFFEIMKVIKGKRTMLDNTIDFLKCEVIRVRQIS
jgi:hypothetical protein